jgi:hypothetical protein
MRKAKRLEQENDQLRLTIEGPEGLREQLRLARQGERIEWRNRKQSDLHAKDLQEALEALIDVQPYLHANPDHPSAQEWEQRRQDALDQAAKALEATAGPGGYRVK